MMIRVMVRMALSFWVRDFGSVVVIETDEGTTEGEGFTVGGENCWVDDASWRNNEGYYK